MKPSDALKVVRLQGLAGVRQSVSDRLLGRTATIAAPAAGFAHGARGLEIGGPSGKFRRGHLVPLYDEVASLDNVNFAGATLWEHGLRDGGEFTPVGRRLGTQYLREAAHLNGLEDSAYDLVLSSHTLEHLANPLPALREWRRVCREGGHLVLVLPHRDGTFDRRRPVTALSHLLDDERRDITEGDTTHVQQILTLHDLRRDPYAGTRQAFEQTVSDNVHTRAMHHHVFDADLALRAVITAGWTPLAAEARRPHDLIILALNRPPPKPEPAPGLLVESPFPSDQRR